MPFLELPFKMDGILLTPCFWKVMWEFISEHDICLLWADKSLPKGQSKENRFIVEELACGSWHERSRAHIVQPCEAVPGSDDDSRITMVDGLTIHADAIGTEQTDLGSRTSKHDRHTMMGQVFKTHFSLNVPVSNLELIGRWLPDTHMVWPWHYSPKTGHLYSQCHGDWHEYAQQRWTQCSTYSHITLWVAAPATRSV